MCSDPKAHAKHAEGAMSVLVRTSGDGSSLSAIVGGPSDNNQVSAEVPKIGWTAYGDGKGSGASVTVGPEYSALIDRLSKPKETATDYKAEKATREELTEHARANGTYTIHHTHGEEDRVAGEGNANHHTYNGPPLTEIASGSKGSAAYKPTVPTVWQAYG